MFLSLHFTDYEIDCSKLQTVIRLYARDTLVIWFRKIGRIDVNGGLYDVQLHTTAKEIFLCNFSIIRIVNSLLIVFVECIDDESGA